MIWRHIASNFLTLLIVILIVVAGTIAWARHQYVAPGPSTRAECVRVPQNGRLSDVSKQLGEQGVISSPYIFRAGADYEGKSGQLKYGSFLVPPQASMSDIVAAITKGGNSTCGTEVVYRVGVRENAVALREINPDNAHYEDVARYNPQTEAQPERIQAALEGPDTRLRLTVAEGTTVWQVAQVLRNIPFLKGDPGKLPPEGALAPDTYDLTRDQERSAILGTMASRQTDILNAAWEGRAEGLPYASPQEALIMASIVEKETGIPDERRRVASVFVNRLEQGMKLQTDPTVIYGVTKGQGVLDRGLRASELRTRTPYNTYVIEGLPPTPIANPGREAIDATMHPDTTEYLFFVADGSGGHAFATTLEEHNANVARWRETERQNNQRNGVQGVQTGG
ncbi:endolytic transglycosylase MltG [Paracoccus pacificus]|uniref:Endolytic murein transglycosylase n=1 Tax=Paracoccus pacificus TaxID=1463598 RepID=A0ABW4R8F6_9RHOB